jgi:hypothetical protein
MDKTELNRKLREALGYLLGIMPVPDYVGDPRLVLREMQKREGFSCFLSFLMFGSENDCLEDELIYAEATLQIVDLILDDTGKLAQLALDWLEREKKG